MNHWNFAKAINENETFCIEGLNIWNYHWECTNKKVEVQGPYEGQVYYFKEYCIRDGDKSVKFVAGEYSNGKMGIYVKDHLSEGNI